MWCTSQLQTAGTMVKVPVFCWTIQIIRIRMRYSFLAKTRRRQRAALESSVLATTSFAAVCAVKSVSKWQGLDSNQGLKNGSMRKNNLPYWPQMIQFAAFYSFTLIKKALWKTSSSAGSIPISVRLTGMILSTTFRRSAACLSKAASIIAKNWQLWSWTHPSQICSFRTVFGSFSNRSSSQMMKQARPKWK